MASSLPDARQFLSTFSVHQNTLSRSSKAKRNYAKEYSTAEE